MLTSTLLRGIQGWLVTPGVAVLFEFLAHSRLHSFEKLHSVSVSLSRTLTPEKRSHRSPSSLI